MKHISNIKWRFEFTSATEPLFMMKKLFTPQLISELKAQVSNIQQAPNIQKTRDIPTNDLFRFWFASNLQNIKHSQHLSSQHIQPTKARSICLEFIPLESTKLNQDMIQSISQKLKEQGWIRFKLRKQEALTPLFSWRQCLSLDLLNRPSSTPSKLSPYVESSLTSLEIMCHFMGPHAECERALTKALKIAQTKLSEASSVFQLQTLSADVDADADADIMVTRVSTGMPAKLSAKLSAKLQIFSFVFSKVDYYFWEYLKTQQNFSIELIYPSIHHTDAGIAQWCQTYPDLGQCIWTSASLNIHIPSQESAFKESQDQTILRETLKANHETKDWLALKQKQPLRWTQERPIHALHELDALLITDNFVDALREYLLSLPLNYRQVYSIALLEINQSSYYLMRLSQRAKIEDKEAQQYGVSKYWTLEHIQLFKSFIQELKEIESDGKKVGDSRIIAKKVLLFRQVARQPLVYLSLEAELKPKLDDQGLLKRVYAQVYTQSKDSLERLYLLSPQLAPQIKRMQITTETSESLVTFTELDKPTFYHAEDFPLILQPKRLANIQQWFDEAFLSLTPEAFDE